jgi:hypothetical protein
MNIRYLPNMLRIFAKCFMKAIDVTSNACPGRVDNLPPPLCWGLMAQNLRRPVSSLTDFDGLFTKSWGKCQNFLLSTVNSTR